MRQFRKKGEMRRIDNKVSVQIGKAVGSKGLQK